MKKLEPYDVKTSYPRFKKDLDYCLNLTLSIKENSTLKDLIELQSILTFLAKMCSNQSVFQIGKVKPLIALRASANCCINLKDDLVDNGFIKETELEFQNIVRNLTILGEAIDEKCEIGEKESINPENVRQTIESLRERNVPESVIEQYKKQVADIEEKLKDKGLYNSLRTRFSKEKKLIKKAIKNKDQFVQASISVFSFFRKEDLKAFEHTRIVIPSSDDTNYSNMDNTVPLHVFHNQTLAIINVKPGKNFFKKVVRPNFDDLKEKARSATDKMDLTERFSVPYLISPLFKNIRFVWFVDKKDMHVFQNIKEGSINLVWDNHD